MFRLEEASDDFILAARMQMEDEPFDVWFKPYYEGSSYFIPFLPTRAPRYKGIVFDNVSYLRVNVRYPLFAEALINVWLDATSSLSVFVLDRLSREEILIYALNGKKVTIVNGLVAGEFNYNV